VIGDKQMSNIKQINIECPCCNKKIVVQISKNTGEITCVPFYTSNKNQYEVDALLKKLGIEFGTQEGGEIVEKG